MTQAVPDSTPSLWRRLVESNATFNGAIRDFLAPNVDRVALIQQGLKAGGMERATALQIIPHLDSEERKRLFSDIVKLASSAHGSIGVVRNLILGLPRDFVLANLEREAEPFLREEDDDYYRRFLELFWLLDRGMTRRLAERAAAHSDLDIREAGDDFKEKLNADA